MPKSLSPGPSRETHLPEIALEAHALGDLKRRDDAALDFACRSLASGSKFPAGAVEVSRKPVVFAGFELREQLLDGLLDLSEFLDERLTVHYRVMSRCLQD